MARSQAGEQSFGKFDFDLNQNLKVYSSLRGINSDEAVAYGAAVQARVLSGEQDTGKLSQNQAVQLT